MTVPYVQRFAYFITLSSVFALVTDSGHLIVYNINHPEKPWEKIAAHGAEASTLDWHPTRPYIIATGGVADRSVKSTLIDSYSLCCVLLLSLSNAVDVYFAQFGI